MDDLWWFTGLAGVFVVGLSLAWLSVRKIRADIERGDYRGQEWQQGRRGDDPPSPSLVASSAARKAVRFRPLPLADDAKEEP